MEDIQLIWGPFILETTYINFLLEFCLINWEFLKLKNLILKNAIYLTITSDLTLCIMHLFTHRFFHRKKSFPFKSFCTSLSKSTSPKYIQKFSTKKIHNAAHICYEINDFGCKKQWITSFECSDSYLVSLQTLPC